MCYDVLYYDIVLMCSDVFPLSAGPVAPVCSVSAGPSRSPRSQQVPAGPSRSPSGPSRFPRSPQVPQVPAGPRRSQQVPAGPPGPSRSPQVPQVPAGPPGPSGSPQVPQVPAGLLRSPLTRADRRQGPIRGRFHASLSY